jgi:hypothetical protein
VANGNCGELHDFAQEKRVARGNNKPAGSLWQVSDDIIKFLLGAGLHDVQLQPKGARRILRVPDLDLGNGRVLGIDSQSEDRGFGHQRCSSSIRFGPSSIVICVAPVTLPPGRAILVTSPSCTGSLPVVKTIGIVVVAFFAASAAGVLVAAITATRRLIRSAAKSGSRS